MEVIGDYRRDGYAHLKGLVGPEIGQALLGMLRRDIGPDSIPLSKVTEFPNLLKRPAFEVYGHHYPVMQGLLWGLTPVISQLSGKDLLPTYGYLRIYREGDVCQVHFDRPSCQHSVSLTLDYSDGAAWPLEIGTRPHEQPDASVEPDFGDEPFSCIPMGVGDAVLYRGTSHRHGRISPNPNGWSAHLFLHWVERGGIYADHAFDRQLEPSKVNFSFA